MAEYTINGKALKENRLAAGLTQAQLAQACGIPQHLVAHWEAGASGTRDKIESLANVFGVNPEELILQAGPARARNPRAKYNPADYTPINRDRLRQERKKASLSIKDMADLCGVSYATAHGWESGHVKTVAYWNMESLASYFDVAVEELAAETAEKKPEEPAKTQAAPAVQPEPQDAKIGPEPEKQFARNVLYYAKEKGVSEKEFDRAVGCDFDFLEEVIVHGFKIPLDVLLKAARFLGKTVEQLACEDTAAEAERRKVLARMAELEEELRALRDLQKKLGG